MTQKDEYYCGNHSQFAKMKIQIFLRPIRKRVVNILFIYYRKKMAGQQFQEYNNRFSQKYEEMKGGPVEKREVTDVCCIFVFALIAIGTLGGGIYFIVEGSSAVKEMIENPSNGPYDSFGKVMATFAGPIVGMLVLSVVLSVVYLVLCKLFTKCVVYTIIAVMFVVYVGLIVFGILFSIALAVVFGIILFVNVLLLYCFWGYVTTGIMLTTCAAKFITEKPAVYVISLLCLIINGLYLVFWGFAWIGVYSLYIKGAREGEYGNFGVGYTVLVYVWYADAIFFGFFLYYCMVFLIGNACAYWYYQHPDNSILKGFNYIKFHIGTITFGAIVLTILTILRLLSESQGRQNGAARCIALCIRCCLQFVEDLIKVLNHNAIIVTSMTGQGYIDSAKSAIGLIFHNFGLFIIIDFFVNFMSIYAMIVSVLLPAVLGGGIIYLMQESGAQMSQAISNAVIGGIIILLLAMIISSVVFGMIEQALSCIYIFYCLEKKAQEMGIHATNIPGQIKEMMDRAGTSEQSHEATMQYMNRG